MLIYISWDFLDPTKFQLGPANLHHFSGKTCQTGQSINRLESLRSIEAKGSKVHLGRVFGSLRPTILDVEIKK